jgi:hypothetical protein
LQLLSSEFNVFITSAAMEVPRSFDAKFRWLQEHFPFIPTSNIVFCGDKEIVDADYLIDDRSRHFARFRGTGILITAPHNARERAQLRASNWDDVLAILMKNQSALAVQQSAKTDINNEAHYKNDERMPQLAPSSHDHYGECWPTLSQGSMAQRLSPTDYACFRVVRRPTGAFEESPKCGLPVLLGYSESTKALSFCDRRQLVSWPRGLGEVYRRIRTSSTPGACTLSAGGGHGIFTNRFRDVAAT